MHRSMPAVCHENSLREEICSVYVLAQQLDVSLKVRTLHTCYVNMSVLMAIPAFHRRFFSRTFAAS